MIAAGRQSQSIAFDGNDFGTIGTAFGIDLLPTISTPPLLPGASISANLGNGPGIQEVATFSVDVSGPNGAVAVSNAHGTVTGAAGGVLLRPYARLIASTGDSVSVPAFSSSSYCVPYHWVFWRSSRDLSHAAAASQAAEG